MSANPQVESFTTSGGGRIYQLPVEVFPDFWSYVYLVLVDDLRVLIDAGSGFGNSNDHLEAGLSVASERAGQPIRLADLTHILITHGHIDHIGGLSYIRPRTAAQLGVHELDRRILTRYEERLALVARRLRQYWVEAGVSSQRLGDLLDMYLLFKGLYHSQTVDFTYEAEAMRLGPFDFLHVPGHTAGHVVIRLHDILFSGDHVLDDISPHQAPEHLTLSTGLEHYLQSLDALLPWAEQVRLTLGGHYQPITDLKTRLAELRALHANRLERVLDFLREPHTIVEVSQHLFREVHGYHVLLAIEEAGANVEYLYQRDLVGIANLAEIERDHEPIPILYQAREG